MKKLLLMMAVMAVSVTGCAGNNPKQGEDNQPKAFKMVDIPAMLSTPEQKSEYLSNHYWDNFDFSDTSLISHPEITEQAFADYVSVLPYFAGDYPARSVRKTLELASVDTAMLSHFISMFETYLYDPNSPMRNEEAYIPVLEWIVASVKVDSLAKLRPVYQLEMARKNRPGTKAADFQYKTSQGAVGSVYGIDAPLVLLYFKNPGCQACAEVQSLLSKSPLVTDMVAGGKLKIAAIYPDEDLAEWRKEQSQMPKSWINGYDDKHVLRSSELYDLRAIPSLYLLDKDKTVLLKDAGPNQVIRYLIENQ